MVSRTGVIGPDRTIVATDRSFPMPAIQAPERSYVKIPRVDGDPLYISEVNRGNYSGSPQFLIAEHKRNPDGSDSGGIVAVSLQLSNFADYYRSVLDSEDYIVTMTRSDGAILIRYPSDDSSPTMFPPGSKFLEQIAQGAARGRFQEVSVPDSELRLFAFRRVAGYPVYVTVGYARRAVVVRWAQFMESHLLFGLPAMLMLIVLALVGLRRSLAADWATAAAREEAERRLAAEEALRQAQKMEAIGQLTGGVAHDFNNILQIILGNLSIVEFRLQERRLEPALRRAIEAATRAAGRAAVLTGQLLAFSRQQALEPRPVDPNQLIGKLSDLLHRTLGESIEIETLLGARIWKILVDPNQLENAIV